LKRNQEEDHHQGVAEVAVLLDEQVDELADAMVAGEMLAAAEIVTIVNEFPAQQDGAEKEQNFIV
jgi:hypothetical protein